MPEQKRSTTHAIVEEMTQVILSSDDEQQILMGMTTLAGRYLQMDRAMIFNIDFKDDMAKGLVEWIDEEKPELAETLGYYPLSYYCNSVPYMLKERAPIVSYADDVHPLLADEPSGEMIHVTMGIRTVLWYPVYFYEDGFYVLVFNKAKERKSFSDEDYQNISMLSNLLHMALQKIKYLHEIEAKSELHKHTAEQLENLVETIPDAIFFKDGEGRWKVVNSIGKQLFQLDTVDWVGKTDTELADLQPHLKGAYENCIVDDNRAWEKGSVYVAEEHVADEQGKIHTFDVRKVPIFEPDGKRKGLVVIGRDVTAYKNLNDQLQTLNDTLEKRVLEETRKNRKSDQALFEQSKKNALSNLLTNISHHWRQPLNQLGLLLQNLTDENETGEFSEMKLQGTVQRCMTILKEMSSTIDHFRNITVDRDQFLPFEVNAILDEIINLYQPLVQESGIQLNYIQTGTRTYLKNKQSDFSQNIIALIENSLDAIKHSQPEEKVINISTSMGDGGLQICLEDSGKGVPKDILPHIFDPYFTSKEVGQGTGLGLYHVRQYFESLGGEITLENIQNGARCLIKIPQHALAG